MITLEKLKSYLSIDQDFTDDDQLLVTILNNSESAVLAYTNGMCYDSSLDLGYDSISENVECRKDAMVLMMCAEIYNNRELQTNGSLKTSPVWDILASPLTKYDCFG